VILAVSKNPKTKPRFSTVQSQSAYGKMAIIALLVSLCLLILSSCSAGEVQEIDPIFKTDPLAILTIAGTYEWVEGYYTYGNGDSPFIPIEFDDMPEHGASIIYTFTLEGTFRADFNRMGYTFDRGNRYDAREYVTVFRGTFDAEQISLADVSINDRLLMKYAEERFNTDWYRVVMHDESSLHGFSEIEMIVSRANDDDTIFYTPIRKGIPEAETSRVVKTRQALEVDFDLVEVIAGTYFDEKSYDSSNGTFVSLQSDERRSYTFNPDASFRIEAVDSAQVLHEGILSPEQVTLDDIDEDTKLLMPGISERGDESLYRIKLLDFRGEGFVRGFELFVSHISDDDVVIYLPMFELAWIRVINERDDVIINTLDQAVTARKVQE